MNLESWLYLKMASKNTPSNPQWVKDYVTIYVTPKIISVVALEEDISPLLQMGSFRSASACALMHSFSSTFTYNTKENFLSPVSSSLYLPKQTSFVVFPRPYSLFTGTLAVPLHCDLLKGTPLHHYCCLPHVAQSGASRNVRSINEWVRELQKTPVES